MKQPPPDAVRELDLTGNSDAFFEGRACAREIGGAGPNEAEIAQGVDEMDPRCGSVTHDRNRFFLPFDRQGSLTIVD
jgi:hypothetical protein